MSIKKQFLKSKDVCKVTWTVDKKVAKGAENVSLSGSFNDWSLDAHPFKKLKSGDFKLVLELPKDQKYEFRYLVDGNEWINEEEADGYVDNQVSNESNCLISL
ncbi:isoamylase early set domain-containing protein [Reichenbachiella ulvae]|uniref:Isoamylase early set domain-containing protein n=1 Tax=Reichenbachiella ulvae TaxID=2980104 RepID=A0ABT3CV68_9BACT|nr:isoamylase early set domain-containing protein [Reichenbachiella ulvae]MCV9387591.1 isoamylase early set domain-containing protein [Reichenbachiella ulvae]